MPKDAIVVSQEGDWTFYVCRAFHEVCHCFIHLGTELTLYGSREVSVSVLLEARQMEDLHRVEIGKASEVFKKGAVIGYAHKEIHVGSLERLSLFPLFSICSWIPTRSSSATCEA